MCLSAGVATGTVAAYADVACKADNEKIRHVS